MRNTFYFLLFCPSVFHSSVEISNCLCKVCNNIKRRYGRVNNNLFSMSFLPSFMCMCSAQWMIAIVNFLASVQTHRYFWQAFDVAVWWAVPLQWPLNGVNTPFTVQIKAAALCFSEYLIAHHLKQNALLLSEHCWPTGPNLLEKWNSCIKTELLSVNGPLT